VDGQPLLRRITTGFVALTVLAGFVACGGDDGAGPEQNQPPYFTKKPAAEAPNGSLLRVVPGDQIGFSALAIDPDIEDVSYRWDIDPPTGAGFLAGADTPTPLWTVGELGAAVTVWCTITDGRDSTSAKVGRLFAPGTPVDHLTISADMTWTLEDSPYVILGNLTIDAPATLTIEAGVEVQFRADRASGVEWDKRSLNVSGQLITQGLVQEPVLIHGGFAVDPDPGPGEQQFKGIAVLTNGSVSMSFTRVVEADVGLRDLSSAASTLEFSNFTDCGTGVRIAKGPGTTVRGCVFRDNSVGLQLNNSAATVEDCRFESSSLYGIDVDASSGAVTLEMSGCEFNTNLQAHLRMGGSFPNVIAATVKGTNFLAQSGRTPSINLVSADCRVYALDLRGNYWGSVSGPADIRDTFAGDRFCDAGVMSWTDFDCGGDPDACDWSPQPW